MTNVTTTKKTGMMDIAFTNGIIKADAKTGIVRLTDILEIGNAGRIKKGLPVRELREFWRNADTQEFMKALYESEERSDFNQGGNPHSLKNVGIIEVIDYKKELTRTKMGLNGGTWSGLILALKLATWLDKDLEVEVYQMFISNKILDTRLLGVDNFKELNNKVKAMCEASNTTPNYMLLAMEVNKKCNGGTFVKGFDVATADSNVQKTRAKIISTCITLIDMNMFHTFADVLNFVCNFK